MKFVFYTHSLVSDWNHGNAHFLRGVMRDLARRGHEALACEPADSWSRKNLLAERGEAAVTAFHHRFPDLQMVQYGPEFDHASAVADADVVVVHEWTDPTVVSALGELRLGGGRFTLLFHDTHHRGVTAETEITALDLDGYDAVLAFGGSLRDRYQRAGWADAVFVWHEAADDTVFHPLTGIETEGDLVWVGNWGDGERSAEIAEYLIEPVAELGLSATVHGVRYPTEALQQLAAAGIRYGGWIANAEVPHLFGGHRVTVHIPRRPYVEHLPGIPTIRVFEALACGIPLVSAPWRDSEGLFRAGEDYLVANDGAQMKASLRAVLNDPDLASSLRRSGLERIKQRHTCRHRVNELLDLLALIGTQRVTEQLENREAAQ